MASKELLAELEQFKPVETSKPESPLTAELEQYRVTDATPLKTTPKTVYLSDKRETLEYSGDLDDDTIGHNVGTSVYGEKSNTFMNKVRMPLDLAKNFVKGSGSFFAGIPSVVSGLVREKGMRFGEIPTAGEIFFDVRPNISTAKLLKFAVAANTDVDERILALGDMLLTENQKFLKKHNVVPDEGKLNKFAFDLGSGGASLVTALGLAYATKNPAAVSVLFGGIAKGSFYNEALEAGKTPQEAGELSDIVGIGEGALEFIGLETWVNTLRGSKVIPRILLRSGTEFIQEGSQQLSEELIAKLSGVRDKEWKQIALDVGYSALIGLAMGAPSAVVTTMAEQKGVIGKLRKLGLNDNEANEVITALAEKQKVDSADQVTDMVQQEITDLENETPIKDNPEAFNAPKPAEDAVGGTISEGDKGLLEEAKKYKTAEEFSESVISKKTMNVSDIGFAGKGVQAKIQNISQNFVNVLKDFIQGKETTGRNAERFKLKDFDPVITVELVDGKFLAEDGNHRLEAYRQLGIKEVPVKFIESTKAQLTAIFNKSKKAEVKGKQAKLTTQQALKQELADLEDLETSKQYGKIPSVQKKITTLLKQRINDIESGMRKGKVLAKKEVRDVQKAVKELFRAADQKIPPSITSIQTQDQLIKSLPKIKERIAATEAVQQKRKSISQLKKVISDVDIKKIRPEFKEKIKALVDSIDLKKLSESKIKDLESLARALENEDGNLIPEKRISELRRLSKTSVGDMATEQIDTITASILHLQKLNQLKNKILIKNKLRDFFTAKFEAIRNINNRIEKLNDSVSGLDSFQQEQESPLWERIFIIDAYNAELKSQILDGGDNGIIQQIIYREIDDGVSNSLRYLHNAEDFFKGKLKGVDILNWSKSFQTKAKNVDKVTIKLSGNKTIKMSKAERVAFYLHTLNTKNLKHLQNGGFSFSESKSKIIKLTSDDIAEIATSLTEDEITVANTINEYLNTIQKDEINKVSVDLLGHDQATEPDYFPIRTNSLDRFKELLVKTGNFTQISLEGLGMFKERQDASNAIILDDVFVALYKSLKNASAYVGLAKPLRGANSLLNDNDFQIAMQNAGLKSYLDSLKSYLKVVEGESVRLDNVDKITNALINKLDVAVLGWNPFVMLKQPISYLGAAMEMDIKYLQQAGVKFLTKAELKEISKYSPHLRDRFEGNVTREMGELAEVGRVLRFFTGKEVANQKYMKGISNFDSRAIAGIWRAVKLEVKDKNPNLEGDAYFEKVAERAWQVIRRTQPTFHVKDRSTIGQSRNTFTRLLTKYSSQRNKNWMMIRRAFEDYNYSAKAGKDKGLLAKKLSIVAIFAPLMLMAVDKLRDIIFRRDDERTLLRQMTTDFIRLNFGSIYFLGPAIDSLMSKIDKGTYAGYDISTTAVSTMNELVDTAAHAVRGIEQAITKEEFIQGDKKGEAKWKDSLSKTATGIWDIGGKIKGVPAATIRKWLDTTIKVFYKPQKKSKYGG